MGGRARLAIEAALKHEGWDVRPGREPGVIDLEAHQGPVTWFVCVSNQLKGETEAQAWPKDKRVSHLIAIANEKNATPVVALYTGEQVSFWSAKDRTPLRG